MVEIDPETVRTSADLSRADIAVLLRECRDRRVVEFGSGGSTELLAQVALELTTVDTSKYWLDAAARAVERLGERKRATCSFYLMNADKHDAHVAARERTADVHFVDGLCSLRAAWVAAVFTPACGWRHAAKVWDSWTPPTPLVIVHDTRRMEPVASLTFLLKWPVSAFVKRLEFEANMLLIHLNKKPVRYENWNITEPENRKKIHE